MILVSLVSVLVLLSNVQSLNNHVDSYEVLNYKQILNRQKRSISKSPIDLQFRAYNRTFRLKLTPIDLDSNVFAEDNLIDVDGNYTHEVSLDHLLYEGYLKDDPASFAYGSLIDGIFDGHIIAGDGQSFTIEKSARYFPLEDRPSTYHSIIYPDESITHKKFRRPKRQIRDNYVTDSDDNGGCGLRDELHENMRQFQQSAIPDTNCNNSNSSSKNYESYLESSWKEEPYFHENIYGESFLSSSRHANRIRRSLEFREIRGRKVFEVRTCSIYLQTDHKLYEHIFYKEGNRDHIRTREELVSLLYNHVKAVNQIYEGADFGGIRGINFAIQRISIYTSDTCMGGKSVPPSDNPFCEENVDVSNYLNLNSQKDHSAFCLAYSITYRDFVGGTLGLAWVASPSQSTAGGICQTYQRYNEHSRGGVSRSLNTGIITMVNYGNRIPLRVSQLTLAHEIGHNFGSPHDFPFECQPGLPNGNFIMFASATSGDKPNNSKFSTCSVNNITEVLYEVLQQNPKIKSHGKKRNCFTDQRKSFCGNQIREPGEECDCGFTKQDCENMGDKCCIPRDEAPSDRDNCKRKPGKMCSPSEGLCCKPDTCSFYTIRERRLCREDSECQFEQHCSGAGPECPESVPKHDGLPCQNTTKVCHQGACNGSICAQAGLKDCFLTEGKPEQLCFLACEKNGLCLSSSDLPELKDFTQYGRKPGQGLLLHPGSPCNNYKGYCDIFRKCRSVDANGPLARLKSLVFNPETINTMSQWVKEHWWACVLIGLAILMLMALFVKCCAVHTPSTNPNKLPPAHFTETLRHPGTLLRRGHQRQQNRNHRQQNANSSAPQGRVNANRRAAPQIDSPRIASGPSTSRATINAVVVPLPSTSRSVTTAQPPREITISPTPIAEPPPPYQLVDPAIATGSSASGNNRPTATVQLLPPALNATVPAPVVLPGAPAPQPGTSSSLPLIPGPPLQGPKPGHRRPKPEDPKQIKKKATAGNSNEKSRGISTTSGEQKKATKRPNK